MNRRANVYLNIIGFISFILLFIFFIFTMRIESMVNTNYLYRNITLILTFLSSMIFVSVECLLFVLLQKNYKILEIISLMLEIIFTIYINSKIPYTFIIVLLSFNLVKDILRIVFVNKIYINRRFTTYCKRYGIKINDWKRTYKKKKRTPKKKDTISIPVPTNTATSNAISTNI